MLGNVVIQDNTAGDTRWLSLSRPVRILRADKLSEVGACLKELERETARGAYAAGFIAYEASPAFDHSLTAHSLLHFPYLWFALYDHCTDFDIMPDVRGADYELGDWRRSLSWRQYDTAINKILRCIRDGESYQVNYTHKLWASFQGDAWALFLDLYQAQHARYSAYIDAGRYQILSVSPELFFCLEQGCLISRPMKGTVARGLSADEDKRNAAWLQASLKNRAENLMIVDMLRNDMGKVADTGSVAVDRMFEIESYPTVYQMTSTVKATTSAKLSEIFSAMFPCASVTGAPKAKTMELIRDLEPQPRGVYTGSIGFIKPNGIAQFNVAIRTAVVDTEKDVVEYGTGGGIVWDSDAVSEYRECELKAAVLKQFTPDLKLLETILLQKDKGYYRLDDHLQRLQTSAEYFALHIDRALIDEKLEELAMNVRTDKKVRLVVGAHNNIELQAEEIKSIGGGKIVLDDVSTDTRSVYCRHKTTHREIYQQAIMRHPGYDDVILVNSDGHITETTIANIVLELNGVLMTPALHCGLLAGVFRRLLLEKGILHEADLSVEQLRNAERVFLVNSVRGWITLQRTGPVSWRIRQNQPNLSAALNPGFITDSPLLHNSF